MRYNVGLHYWRLTSFAYISHTIRGGVRTYTLCVNSRWRELFLPQTFLRLH